MVSISKMLNEKASDDRIILKFGWKAKEQNRNILKLRKVFFFIFM